MPHDKSVISIKHKHYAGFYAGVLSDTGIKEIVESAVREAICRLHPEYAQGWLINSYLNIGDLIFVCTKP